MPSLPHGINRGVEIVIETIILGIIISVFYLIAKFGNIPLFETALPLIQLILALTTLSLILKMKHWATKYIAGVLIVILPFLILNWNNTYFLSPLDKFLLASMTLFGLWLIIRRMLY